MPKLTKLKRGTPRAKLSPQRQDRPARLSGLFLPPQVEASKWAASKRLHPNHSVSKDEVRRHAGRGQRRGHLALAAGSGQMDQADARGDGQRRRGTRDALLESGAVSAPRRLAVAVLQSRSRARELVGHDEDLNR